MVAAFRVAGGDGYELPNAEALGRLIKRIKTLPAPACHYRLRPNKGAAELLPPEPALAGVEDRWRSVFPGGDEDEDDDANPWTDTR